MVVIDCLGALFSPLIGPNPHGHSLMLTLSRELRAIAAEHNVAVLVTNHVVGNHVARPALGESWQVVPHSRLWFHRDAESCAVVITKTKSVDSPQLVRTQSVGHQ
eukprot:TRINITY_DN5070_c0_g1_i3.p1 TRINITY_DN5070_c0_g1~~TRINITY_DN5070_c0_g1_i3.p1  ORF type:complete len:105 (-),score=24.27 TRINITY_DN5070_c0_g1_i3:20-334(-)